MACLIQAIVLVETVISIVELAMEFPQIARLAIQTLISHTLTWLLAILIALSVTVTKVVCVLLAFHRVKLAPTILRYVIHVMEVKAVFFSLVLIVMKRAPMVQFVMVSTRDALGVQQGVMCATM